MIKKRYRATVWVLSAQAESDEDIRRRIVTSHETSMGQFLARTMDALMRDVDDQVWFGPVSCR